MSTFCVYYVFVKNVLCICVYLQGPAISVEEFSEHSPSDESGLIMQPVREKSASTGNIYRHVYVVDSIFYCVSIFVLFRDFSYLVYIHYYINYIVYNQLLYYKQPVTSNLIPVVYTCFLYLLVWSNAYFAKCGIASNSSFVAAWTMLKDLSLLNFKPNDNISMRNRNVTFQIG